MALARIIGALLLMTVSALGQEVHYSPEERLDTIDAVQIASAKSSIDLASYALTDPIVLDALNAAERRGVAIRVILDPRERHDFVKLGALGRRTSAPAARTRRTMT
jgi:phosphatidylserine/phosphatidylglycerophosphate/cardiolipin synthase-like enzyme